MMIHIDRHTHRMIRCTLTAICGLSVYGNLRSDPVVTLLRNLLSDIIENTATVSGGALASDEGSLTNEAEGKDLCRIADWIQTYSSIFSALLSHPLASAPDFGEYIISVARFDDNPFVRMASGLSRASSDGIGPDTRRAVLSDFERIRQIASFPSRYCIEILAAYSDTDLPEWRHLSPEYTAERLYSDFLSYHRENSFGVFSKYHAFIWKKDGLEPVETPDPIRLTQLFSYEYEISQVKENTLRLLERRRADNLLLFGARGTGKSSTVKAIANEYKSRGLRLIEIDKDCLLTIGDLLSYLAGLSDVRLAFILFLDDLTFPEDDHRYTVLKTLLEGGMKTRPENVAIYATSNRRHIVAEKESDDMYANDAREERLSLSDRFGISVRFSSPNQVVFLNIVYGILSDRNVSFDREITAARALTWAMRENGRSPRTARQFADFYESELHHLADPSKDISAIASSDAAKGDSHV